jgi:periplasmic copper chaperone A
MRYLIAGAVAVLVMSAAPAYAHVTVQPPEGIVGNFSRFVVRVPNERDDASTTKVVAHFPPLAVVSFMDVPGWEREVKMQKLDEPIEGFGGAKIRDVVGTVTWSGGEIGPGEFLEFPFSALMPGKPGEEGEEELEFPTEQTYDNGEVVNWDGPEDGDSPAAVVETVSLGDFLEEGHGELGALHEIAHEVEEMSTRVEQMGASHEAMNMDEEPAAEYSSDTTGMLLGSIGIALGLIALIVALMKRRA